MKSIFLVGSVFALLAITLVLGFSQAEVLEPCSSVLSRVGTDGKHVCYEQGVATTAPQDAHDAFLYEAEEISFIVFTIEGHGNHTTMSRNEETWSAPLPSHRPGNLSQTTSSPYSMVHLITPMIQEWYTKLEDNGIRIHAHLGHGWYLMDATDTAQPIEDFVFIDRATDFNASDKLEEGLTELQGEIPIIVRSMPNRPDAYNDSRAALEGMGATITARHPDIEMVEANISATNLSSLAEESSIIRIEAGNLTTTVHMDAIRQTTGAQAMHDITSDLAPDGFKGNGVTAMIMDESHDKSNEEIDSSIAGYWPNEESIKEGTHGAIVFAIAHADDVQDFDRAGMAPNASSVIAQARPLARYAAAEDLNSSYGGTLQSHSWGLKKQAVWDARMDTDSPAFNTYDLRAVEEDLIEFKAGILAIQSMGNDGPGRAAAEAMAKNGISVGGMYHNDDTNRTNDTWASEEGTEDNGEASTGPTFDCRVKPDLVGPYDRIDTYGKDGRQAGFKETSGAAPVVSGAAMLAEEMYREGFFRNKTGEDTAGVPSPVLTKALLVNSAHSFRADQAWNASLLGDGGCGPSTEDPQPRHMRDIQGWGQPDLARYQDTGTDTLAIDEPFRLDSGDEVNHTITLSEGTYALQVTLAWTDPPGTPLTNTLPINAMTNVSSNRTLATEPVHRQLVNDLDLEVHSPNGTMFPGNKGLRNATLSDEGVPVIDADRANNVENVFTDAPDPNSTEDWWIVVRAANIQLPHNPAGEGYGQPYSLVIRPLADSSTISPKDPDTQLI